MATFQKMEGPSFFYKLLAISCILSLLSGCSGMRPEQKKTEQAPPPQVEEKFEQASKADPAPPQPPPEPPNQNPPEPPMSPPVLEKPKPPPSPQPVPPPPPPLRTVKILWESVNLRDGPGLQHKVIGNVKRGTSLIVLEERGNWLRVRLEGGKEAWVSKAATSEAPKPPPPSKPKPM